MVAASAGAVVVVRFPFSDLSTYKVRPAIAVAPAGYGDWVLCQVTSNPYSDPNAVQLLDSDFARGSLQRTSYARPGKLFTASESLMLGEAGALQPVAFAKVVSAIVAVITQN
jgi:mRNA interferase MazF